MDEYAFRHEFPAVRGRVVIHAENEGSRPHDLVLVALPEHFSGDITKLTRTRDKPLVLAPVYSIPIREPGEDATFAVELLRGRYALLCFIEDPDGEQHFEKGMVSDFSVL